MKHYHELDSLRGIAALTVVFTHILSIFSASYITKLIEFGPLRFFVSGSEAVILFFILSGFVLYLPLSKGKNNYIEFVIKRFFRIYIPYIIAVTVAFIASLSFYSGSISSLSQWFNNIWNDDLNYATLLGHLSLIGSFDMGELNPVIWSLVHEFRISLIFPLLMMLVIKYRFRTLVIISFSLTVISALLFYMFKFLPVDILQSFYYSHIFIIGATLAKYRVYLVNKFTQLSKRRLLLILSAALFSYLYMKPSFAASLFLYKGMDVFYRSIMDNYFVVLGASTIIILALSSDRLSKTLLNKNLIYLGKISYSLYLYHAIILVSVIHLLYGVIPLWSCLIIGFILSVIISFLSYKYVELPAISAGKKIINKMRKNKEIMN